MEATEVALIHISCTYNLHEGVRKRGGKGQVKAPGLLSIKPVPISCMLCVTIRTAQ